MYSESFSICVVLRETLPNSAGLNVSLIKTSVYTGWMKIQWYCTEKEKIHFFQKISFQIRQELLWQHDSDPDLVWSRRQIRDRKLRGVVRDIKIVSRWSPWCWARSRTRSPPLWWLTSWWWWPMSIYLRANSQNVTQWTTWIEQAIQILYLDHDIGFYSNPLSNWILCWKLKIQRNNANNEGSIIKVKFKWVPEDSGSSYQLFFDIIFQKRSALLLLRSLDVFKICFALYPPIMMTKQD